MSRTNNIMFSVLQEKIKEFVMIPLSKDEGSLSTLEDWIDEYDFKEVEDKLNNEKVTMDELIPKIYDDEFIEYMFNKWETGYQNFYIMITDSISRGIDINELLSTTEYIYAQKVITKYFKEQHNKDINFGNGSTEYCINMIAYWAVQYLNIGEIVKEEFTNKFIKRFNEYLAEIEHIKRDLTVTNTKYNCVVCFANNIYTGCFACKSSFVCYDCYTRISNVCPICRCTEMIKRADCSHYDEHYNAPSGKNLWIRKLYFVVSQLKQEQTIIN